jgi:protein-S-isoprenylcysteine O-methyltransferase Ste14
LVIVWAVFLVVPSGAWQSLDVHGLGVSVLGLVLLIGSTVFTLWARLTLGTMWSMDPVIKQDHEIRTEGPYGVTRHPIYTGILGMLLGTLLLAGVGRWAVLFPVGLVLCEVKIRMEERLLSVTFPDDYPRYRRTVPQLVPGLRIIGRRHADV